VSVLNSVPLLPIACIRYMIRFKVSVNYYLWIMRANGHRSHPPVYLNRLLFYSRLDDSAIT
jgi:hypothetical protein